MRVLLQRVSRAEVRVGDRVTGRIGRGYLLLVGLTHADDEARLAWMAGKVAGLLTTVGFAPALANVP